MLNSPCKNCEERHYKCHCTCKKYINFCNENKALKDKISQIRRAENDHFSFIVSQREKARRGKHSRSYQT